MQRTYQARNEEAGKTWDRAWYLVNADGKRLGRLASEIAVLLQGKHKPVYTPHVDTGDYVVVINAERIALTARDQHFQWLVFLLKELESLQAEKEFMPLLNDLQTQITVRMAAGTW